MLTEKLMKGIERNERIAFTVSSWSIGNSRLHECMEYAAKMRKPIYIFLEKGIELPDYLEGADIRGIVEFEGPYGSESYMEAKERFLEMVDIGPHNIRDVRSVEDGKSLSERLFESELGKTGN